MYTAFVCIQLSVLFRDKFLDFDLRPMCKKCYERLPMEMRKRLKAQADGTVHKTAKVKRVKKNTGFV
jgi:hypothetical protein